MKTNQQAVVLTESNGDHGRIRAVLREWGYGEREIQRFLKESVGDAKLERRDTPDR